MTFAGMDTEQGHEVATQLKTTGSEIQGVVDDITPGVGGVAWIGPDQEVYVEDWNTYANGLVRDLAQVFVTIAGVLQGHAEEQETTSENS
jgi:hypothetical protein